MSKAQQLLKYLESHGPSTAAELSKVIDVKSGVIGGYLSAHVNNGKVALDKSKTPMRYFLRGTPTPAPATPTPTLDKILAATPAVIGPKTPASLDSAIEALATALVGRISEVVEDKVGSLVESIVSRQVASSIDKLTQTLTKPDPVPAVVASLPKVLVCGLLAGQQTMIQKEFSDCFDLRFVNTDANPSEWKSRAAHSDRVFVMTSFISHSHTQAIESVGVKPTLVSNGMTSLRDALTKYYTEVA